MKELVKKCRNCKYLNIVSYVHEKAARCRYTCDNSNNGIIGDISLDSWCKDWEVRPMDNRYIEEGQLLSEEEYPTLSKDEKQSVEEIAKVLEFIKENKLENVNFKYDQVRGIATVNGTKDGYKYSTMISFKRGDKENDK